VSRIRTNKTVCQSLKRRGPPTCLHEKDCKLFWESFNISELEAALTRIKLGKAAGPDKVFPEFLRHLGASAKKTLLALYNLTWTKYVPDQWWKGEIIPVLKQGKPVDSIESYRPISLMSVCCKVMERMVVRRLNQYLESNGLIDDSQAGFRGKRCTTDQIVRFTQNVKDCFQKKNVNTCSAG
jgi:hypothetical protein